MSRKSNLALSAAIFLTPLAACSIQETDQTNVAAAEPAAPADPMASNDDPAAALPAEDQPRPLMQAQVVLDRIGFTPGVVDGKLGMSTVNAIKGFQEARGMQISGKLHTIFDLKQVPPPSQIASRPRWCSTELGLRLA